ncbi:MAG: helix-turn-helix domain-containing protein [Bacteroidetes bacterium]|nr:helix-turn-helix domain-containing protein [Bacteroidota bacterium]
MKITSVSNEEFQLILNTLAEINQKIDSNNEKSCILDQWLTSNAVCKKLNICKRALDQLRARRILGTTKITGKLYFKASQINKILEENYVKPRPQI